MCFYDNCEYDWYALVCDTTTKEATEPCKCIECHREITVGEFHSETFLQQYEECANCEDVEDTCTDGCDYGESETNRTCATCCKFLNAIAEVERDAGCRPSESQPQSGILRDVMVGLDYDEAPKYARRAVEMWPELANHQWVQTAFENEREYA